VAQAAGRIYANPQEATKALLADPKALDRLAAGEAGAYGQIRGQERFLLGKDAVRTQAEREVPNLRTAIWQYRETQARLERQQGALARLGERVPEVRELLDRVGSTLRRPFETLAQGPERVARAAQSLPDQLLPRSEAKKAELEASRAAVQKAAARIFLDPREATRAILADPRALDRLARGETQAYGELHYKARDLGSDGRPKAEHALPAWSAAVRAHQQTERGASLQPSPSPAAPRGSVLDGAQEVQALLTRVTSTLRQVQTLSRGPEEALELAVRTTSRAAVQATLALLPSPVQTPVRLLFRAAERALDLGRELGR